MAFCKVTSDLNKHLSDLDKEQAREDAIENLGEALELAAFKAMRDVINAGIYSDAAPSDLFECDSEYFYEVAEKIIKAAERG